MRSSFRSRHTVAVLACGALVAGLAGLPAGPASAAVIAEFAAQGSANTSSACTLTTGDSNPSSPGATFSSGTRSQSVNLDAAFTNTGDSTDTVSMLGHYATTMTLAKRAGDLSKMAVTGKGNLSVNAAKGSATACDPTALIDLFSSFQFTEGHAGWLYITRNTVPKAGLAVTVIADLATNKNIALDVWQGPGASATSRGFVNPGIYGGEIAVGLTAGNVPPILLKSAPQSSISVVFHKSGSAFSGTTGSGAKFVRFPGSISCSNRTATLTWKSGADKVASGSFFVNGTKKASVSNPQAGHHVVLRHLGKTVDNTITAKLSLNGGGHASAARLYVPCKA